MVLGPVVARTRVLVYEAVRAEELAERRRVHSADHTGLEIEVHYAGHVLAALGHVVENVDAAELRVVVAAVLAAAADVVLVAHHLPKPSAHLVTALARLNENNPVRKSGLKVESTREKKGGKNSVR